MKTRFNDALDIAVIVSLGAYLVCYIALDEFGSYLRRWME
jgi:hypothetical protein